MANHRKAVDGKRKCIKCLETKDEESGFRPRKYDPRFRDSVCRACINKRGREKGKVRKQMLAEIKMASGCVDCGYNEYAVALDFDHLPRHEKSFTISSLAQKYKWERILEEIAKCEVVCSNCHRVRTERRRHGR